MASVLPISPGVQRGPGTAISGLFAGIRAKLAPGALGKRGMTISDHADVDPIEAADVGIGTGNLGLAIPTTPVPKSADPTGAKAAAVTSAVPAEPAAVADIGVRLSTLVVPTGYHPGSAATTGIFRLGFSTDYTETTSVQLTKWITDAQPIPGFRLIGRVDAGGIASLEHNWTIASLQDVPAEKGTIDHRTLHGNASIFTSYGDFAVSAALAYAWGLVPLPGRATANLLDRTFPSGGTVPTPYMPFPHAPGFGLAEPDAWGTAGDGRDSANFELNGNYTDWFAPGAPSRLHDEIDFIWAGPARAATLELSLLQTLGGERVGVELYYQGRLIYAGSPAPISDTGKFQAGNPSIATINLANLSDSDGQPIQLVFDELRLRAASGSFLVNGLGLTMADTTTTPTGGKDLRLSPDPRARSSQILYNAPAPATFGGAGAATRGDGILDISNFDFDRGDQLVLLKTDLVHLQITPTNAGADLAVRFLNDPQSLVLLRGAGSTDIAASFHTVTVGGSVEVILAKSVIPI